MQEKELIPHLFRTEYKRIVSVLCKYFGSHGIEIAEDIVSDTFLTAAEVWGIKGIPPNPTAWLYSVAKNKAKNFLQRNRIFQEKLVPKLLNGEFQQSEEIDLSEENIFDSQLQMMFTVCHPSLSKESQVGLSLRILCGFGIEEIADAFLTNKETIHKRLYRAKEKLREEGIEISFPSSPQIETRLDMVLSTIYLMFNEGYYSVSSNRVLRKELCLEAIRLCSMLLEKDSTNIPRANALLSLMCFHTSRFEARLDGSGEHVLYEDQKEELWNQDFIAKGEIFFQRAAKENEISKYHLEAAIAYWHTRKNEPTDKWENILGLYDLLLQIDFSPIPALNRIFALSKVQGKKEAIGEAEKLDLEGNQFYHALLGELYSGFRNGKAKENFSKALSLAKTPADRSALQKKIDALDESIIR